MTPARFVHTPSLPGLNCLHVKEHDPGVNTPAQDGEGKLKAASEAGCAVGGLVMGSGFLLGLGPQLVLTICKFSVMFPKYLMGKITGAHIG